jgi:hypothetical protein
MLLDKSCWHQLLLFLAIRLLKVVVAVDTYFYHCQVNAASPVVAVVVAAMWLSCVIALIADCCCCCQCCLAIIAVIAAVAQFCLQSSLSIKRAAGVVVQ